MRRYEIMYIIRPTVLEDDRKVLIEELNTIFTSRGAEVTNVNEWGMKDLAYEIEHHKKGYYVWLLVDATPEAVAEFNRVVRITEEVIRFIVVKEGE